MVALIGAPLAFLLIAAHNVQVDADPTWKSLRNPDGDAIHWHSCTVSYAVDLNDYPSSSHRAIDAAIDSTEEASGVDFVEVPWGEADLKIALSRQDRGETLATTQPWITDDDAEYSRATVTVYSEAFEYSYSEQVDNYRHEFGHVLGLDHIEGSDIMNAKVVDNPTRAGWNAGLSSLYQGC